jgi:hypothetical protein
MESTGVPGRIHISAPTYQRVREHYDCEYRGEVEAKGLGMLPTYLVKSKKAGIGQ